VEATRQGPQGDRAKRLLSLIEIAMVHDAATRHKLIRALPVEVAYEPAPGGTIRSLYVRGKLRERDLIADRRLSAAEHPERPDGSEAPRITPDLCEDDEGWAECATEEEQEDAAIYMEALEAEAEGYLSETYTIEADIEAYCINNPWNCNNQASVQQPDGAGANAMEPPCFTEKIAAAAGAVFAIEYAGGKAAVFRGAARVTGRLILGTFGMAGLAIGAATVAVWAAWQCRDLLFQDSLTDPTERWSRPQFLTL
jgi:hypothetical protein